MKKFLLVIITSLLLVGCNAETTESGESSSKSSDDLLSYEEAAHEDVVYEVETDEDNPVAVIKLESGETIAIELYPEYAPNTVNSFIYLANEKEFYDGLIFHRIIEGFMIQGGCPNGTGTGGPGYNIFGEFSDNGYDENILKNKTGTIAMARSQDPDSAGSQFYINVEDNSPLDGAYAVFGKVISGYDTVLKLSQVETSTSDKPEEDIRMSSVRVDTKGKDYPKPEEVK